MFEKTDKIGLDWELDRIAAELEDGSRLDKVQRRLMTMKLLKALLLDVQEGRVETILMAVAGRSDGEKTKQFIFIESDGGNLPGMNVLAKLLNHSITEHMRAEVLSRLRDFLEDN